MSEPHSEHTCARCAHRGPTVRPPIAAKIGLAAVYGLLASMLVAAALSGLMLVAIGPGAIAICAFIQAPLAEAALAPERCAGCGCYA